MGAAALDAEHALNAADERLAAIETSTAWRVVSVARHVLARLAPAGTRRRGAWNVTLEWVGSRMDANRAVPPSGADTHELDGSW
jgi:hypothetical protein